MLIAAGYCSGDQRQMTYGIFEKLAFNLQQARLQASFFSRFNRESFSHPVPPIMSILKVSLTGVTFVRACGFALTFAGNN